MLCGRRQSRENRCRETGDRSVRLFDSAHDKLVVEAKQAEQEMAWGDGLVVKLECHTKCQFERSLRFGCEGRLVLLARGNTPIWSSLKGTDTEGLFNCGLHPVEVDPDCT